MFGRGSLDPAPQLDIQPVGHLHPSLIPALSLYLADPHAAEIDRRDTAHLSFLLLVQHSERVCGLSLALAGCFKMAFLNTFMTQGIPG